MKNHKEDIKKLSPDNYRTIVEGLGEKAFRAKQIKEWLWKKHVCDFDLMTNLSTALRKALKENYYIGCPKIESQQKSIDNTLKVAFRLYDDSIIEGVIIPSGERLTACISSQVGCALGCSFCATGKMGFRRNLLAYEIYDQIFELGDIAEKEFKGKINNVVLMGMGEPLMNYKEVKKAIELMTSAEGMEMSPSRITLSTAGLTEGIKQMADDKVRYNLAISLHTTDDKKRDALMPANKKHNIKLISEAIKYFHEKTGTRVTYEYLLLKDFNDSPADAEKLAKFCRVSPCKINIIEYNPVEGLPYEKSSEKALHEFVKILEGKNIIVNTRKSKGVDVEAACGQLASGIKKNRQK